MGVSHLDVAADSGAVLFDLDGTLADTDPLHSQAWLTVSERRFGVSFTWEQYREACLEHGLTPAAFLVQLGVAPEDAEASDAAAEKSRVFRRLVAKGLTLASGVFDFVRSLDEAHIPIAIVSSGSRRSVDAFVKALWPVGRPVTVSRDDTELQKPDPEPYLLALKQIGRRAPSCVAVEDTNRGILSAKAAGIRTIRVAPWRLEPSPEADFVVEDLHDVAVVSAPHGITLVFPGNAS